MDLRRLSFDAMPPLAVPFRFFVTAPCFAIFVASLFLLAEPADFSSRWTNLLLATTHGITLGFMLMVMIGALFQVLPVVLGVSIPKAEVLSSLIHIFLVIGIACLIGGLYLINQQLLILASAALGIGFSLFFAGLVSCVPAMRNSPSSWAIRLAVLSLLVTVVLGLLFTSGWLSYPRLFTNIHLLWGLVGWTLLLIMGVSFQIIPMFYVTPEYPTWLSRFLPACIFLGLVIVSFSQNQPILWLISTLTLTITSAIYPVYTLYLISKRRRKAQDITLWFWKTSMVSFLIAALIVLWQLFDNNAYQVQLELVLAIIILVGFVLALIIGMLLKIVPFLVWLNLQQNWIKHPSVKMPLSNMQQVIPLQLAKRQYYLFIMMFGLMGIMAYGLETTALLRLTALSMLCCFGYLLYNLLKAKHLYIRLSRELELDSQDHN